MPITWQNINAPSLGNPNQSLQGVQVALGDAFGGLREQLKAFQTNDAQNYEVGKANNTEAFLATLNSRYKTPQELAAAQASGELDQLAQASGAQIDRARVREALDTRGTVLQKRAADSLDFQTKEMAFKDNKEAIDLRPAYGQAMALAKKGDLTGLDAFTKANPQLAARYMGELTAAGITGQRDQRTFDEQLKNWQNQRDTSKSQAESQRISAEASRTSAGAAVRNADTNAGQLRLAQKQLDFTSGEKTQSRLDDLIAKRSQINSTIASREGSQFVIDEIAKFVKDDKDRAKLGEAFGKMASNPDFKNVTPGAALQALLGDVSSGSDIRKAFFNGTGSSAEGKLRDILNSPDSKAYEVTRAAQVQQLDAQIKDLKTQLFPLAPVSGTSGSTGPGPALAAAKGGATTRPLTAMELVGQDMAANNIQAANLDIGGVKSFRGTVDTSKGKSTQDLEAQLKKESSEMVRVDGNRTAFSPEIQQYLKDKAKQEGAVKEKDMQRFKEDELARARRLSREQLGLPPVSR